MKEEEEEILSVSTLDRNLSFVLKDDWTTLLEVKFRKNNYLMHKKLIEKAVSSLETLLDESDDFKEERVKNYISAVTKMWNAHLKRSTRYIRDNDWTEAYEKAKLDRDQEEGALSKFNDEIEFQSDIESHIESLKNKVSVLPIHGNSTRTVKVATYEDKKVSLAMRDIVEQKFPEIKKLMGEKDEKEH